MLLLDAQFQAMFFVLKLLCRPLMLRATTLRLGSLLAKTLWALARRKAGERGVREAQQAAFRKRRRPDRDEDGGPSLPEK
jgi:hypothetical protein